MNILKTILYTLGILLLIDFIGLIMWLASGQLPVDNFFVGTISYHIINLF